MEGIDKLWQWALDKNVELNPPTDSDELALVFLDEIQVVLDNYGFSMVEAMFMEDGVVLKWIDEDEVGI